MLADNKYIICVDYFKNTKEFSYLAEQYNRTGLYTNSIPGTIEYVEFWQDVRDKCLNGFTNSCGQKVTGQHFFYLNFCPILGLNEKTGKKSKIFPRFIDLDYEFFHMVEYCRLNQKSLVAVKGRRQGWSYKAAAICTHEFYFYPDSKAVIGAFFSSFSQNTMNMVVDNSNFINTNTEFRKQRNPDLKDFIKARYQATVGGVKVWKGFNSEVRAISFKDNPTAAVGLSASWLILDEAGVFNNITDTYGYTEPLIKDGSTYTGVSLVFGSSGDMDSGSKYFYEMFTNPEKYNMLDFEDPFNPNARIGFFSSATKGRLGLCLNPESKWYKKPMVDEDGNSNQEAALDDIEFLRAKAKHGLDPKAIHNITTQFPTSWKEAFLRNKGNVFGSPEMLEWLGTLENTPSLRGQAQKGELYFDAGELKWRPNDELLHIIDFPLRKDPKSGESFSTDGCAVVWEHPEKDVNGIVPSYLYVIGIDPYDMDQSESGSLGSAIVYKRFYRADKTHDIIVAEYTSRPKTAEDFYEVCRKLCIYYNAKALYENQLKGLKVYFEQKNSLMYLCEQPGIIKDIVKNSSVQRGYGIHMNRGTGGATGIKDQCELYLKKWLYEEIDGPTEGSKILRFQTIKSIPILKELIAYDREINTDRCLSEGTLITTNEGFKKVEDIRCGDMVLTHTGKYQEVNTISRHKPNAQLLTLNIRGQYENLLVTDNHPIYVKQINRNGVIRSKILEQFNEPAKFIDAGKLKKGDLVLIPKRKNLPKNNFNDDLLYLLGWYIADGHTSNTSFNNRIRICLQGDQEHIADKLIEIIEKYTKDEHKINTNFKTNPTKKVMYPNGKYCIYVEKTSGYLSHLFSKLGGIANNKIIDNDLYNTSNLLPLVLGFFEGDGHQKKKTNYDGCEREVIECAGIYENLLKQMRQILIDNGIWASVCVKNKNNSRTLQYNLTISRKYINKFVENSLKFHKVSEKVITKEPVLENEEGFWVSIKESIPTLYEKDVYNFSVDNDESYVANGIATHNCVALFLCILQTYELHRIHVEELSNTTSSSGAYLDKIWKKGIIFKGKNPSFNASIN